MADQLVKQQPMELVTSEAMGQLSRKFKTELEHSLAKQEAAAIVTAATQAWLAALGTTTAIKGANAAQQSHAILKMALDGEYLTKELLDFLNNTRDTTL